MPIVHSEDARRKRPIPLVLEELGLAMALAVPSRHCILQSVAHQGSSQGDTLRDCATDEIVHRSNHGWRLDDPRAALRVPLRTATEAARTV